MQVRIRDMMMIMMMMIMMMIMSTTTALLKMAMKMMIQNTYTHWLWWNKIPVVDKSRHPISYYLIHLGFFNRSMQAYFEQWLRFMLRWDPKARGGGLCDGRPQCFKVLDTVLSIKVNRN